MYDVKSLKAEEFISDEEIMATLAYADANKDNVEVIDAILAKAREQKGLTHREASVLLACDIPEKIQEMYDLAKKIKEDYYGNRIVMFAPLYLSNYCVNGCVYCPYHLKNKHKWSTAYQRHRSFTFLNFTRLLVQKYHYPYYLLSHY